MTSTEDICASIIKANTPVVFFDTCTVLDIVNALWLDKKGSIHIESAMKLLDLKKMGNVTFVIPHMVKEEFEDNIDTVEKAAEKEILALDKKFKILFSSLALLSPDPFKNEVLFKPYDLHVSAKKLAQEVLENCLIIENCDAYAIGAMNRVRRNIAPASKGKSEPKDCEIIECFFDMSKRLRGDSFVGKIIFVTSNTSDYGTIGKMSGTLNTEFNSVNAEYANNLNHVFSMVS